MKLLFIGGGHAPVPSSIYDPFVLAMVVIMFILLLVIILLAQVVIGTAWVKTKKEESC